MRDKIESKEKYLEKFSSAIGNSGDNSSLHDKQKEALKNALDIRKFEIEMYWKRATYFWTFIAAALAGYVLLHKSSHPANHELSVVISCLGFIFSLGWYLVNRGSKYWQNNWERHVDQLEDQIMGPLYKIVASDKYDNHSKFDFLTKPAEYSVSKINQIISVYVTCIWFILLCASFEKLLFTIYFIIPLTVLMVIVIFKFGKSSNGETVSKFEIRTSIFDE